MVRSSITGCFCSSRSSHAVGAKILREQTAATWMLEFLCEELSTFSKFSLGALHANAFLSHQTTERHTNNNNKKDIPRTTP
eukprot:754714-Hanusia_phi.AAC.3